MIKKGLKQLSVNYAFIILKLIIFVSKNAVIEKK